MYVFFLSQAVFDEDRGKTHEILKEETFYQLKDLSAFGGPLYEGGPPFITFNRRLDMVKKQG